MGKIDKYISQKSLQTLYKEELKTFGRSRINREPHKPNDQSKSVFLSHSHLDKTIVAKISLLLNRLNAEIYIDWLDKSLPKHTNEQTARNIKEKITKCNKFIFLATYHGIRSKWCLWELGIADTLKGNSNVAILPIESNSGNWSGNEYLHLYPEMKFKADSLEFITETDVYIKSIDNEIDLKSWLSN